MRGIYNTSKKEGYKHPRKESVKERPSWLSWRFNAHSMKLAKVSEGESENENPIMAELLPTDEGVFCPTQHLYRNGAEVASIGDFKFELFPLHSPLLRESLLVSFPPLINMLKFSG